MDAHKNPDLETTQTVHVASPSSQDFKEGCSEDDEYGGNMRETTGLSLAAGEDDQRTPPPAKASRRKMMVVVDESESSSGRERLKRHRVEMAGRVWIPDIWGQEHLLQNWIDCTVFDSSLKKSNIMSAREALIQETATSTLSC
ncbi:hypothetical protein Ccrd_009568 [Cynara cardunculus var. scolymus]|uniref:Protein BIC1 n=1 Tax=Cynara cardunculus var. scolymus TaxID=59895 RepID=A0A103YMX8_CYNCS|nr:hypothetical protein Ccrd_009568 [Cynara cardunculus var. scolymus]